MLFRVTFFYCSQTGLHANELELEFYLKTMLNSIFDNVGRTLSECQIHDDDPFFGLKNAI